MDRYAKLLKYFCKELIIILHILGGCLPGKPSIPWNPCIPWGPGKPVDPGGP